MLGSSTTQGRSGTRIAHPPYGLPPHERRRRPWTTHFRGSMASLRAPLSTLRHALAGRRRMTRGQCGVLDLHCKGLAPSTPCRSPDAFSWPGSSWLVPAMDVLAASSFPVSVLGWTAPYGIEMCQAVRS
jgi:hypothetical protein